jgi:hypothetical protein
MKSEKVKYDIINFLNCNGWEIFETSDEFECYCKDGSIGVDVSDDLIVLIDEQGDFAEHQLNGESLYWLIGRLIVCRALSMGFKLPVLKDAGAK